MRLVDRVLAIVTSLILIGVVTVVAIAPETLRAALLGIENVNLVLRVAVVVVLNILILVTLYLGLRSPRKPVNGLAVRARGAHTDVSIESARRLILNAVESVPDVVSANATVKAVNGKADVDMDVQVTGDDIHIPQKQKEISRALQQVINKQLGLRMRGEPRVHIYLQGETPPDSLAAPAASPLPAAAKPEPLRSAPVVKPVAAPAQPEVRDDDDTIIKPSEPAAADKKEDKPGLFGTGLFGQKDEPEEKPADDKADKNEDTSDDWLNSYGSKDEQDKKEKSAGE